MAIENYTTSALSIEPADLRALQAAFDGLKSKLFITEQSDKDMLGMLLMGAYNASRDVARAKEIAEERYRVFVQGRETAKPSGSS